MPTQSPSPIKEKINVEATANKLARKLGNWQGEIQVNIGQQPKLNTIRRAR